MTLSIVGFRRAGRPGRLCGAVFAAGIAAAGGVVVAGALQAPVNVLGANACAHACCADEVHIDRPAWADHNV